jgi:hypothetical protein
MTGLQLTPIVILVHVNDIPYRFTMVPRLLQYDDCFDDLRDDCITKTLMT